MSPSSTMPISEAIEYFGVASVPLDSLIRLVQAGEEYEKDSPVVEELEAEIIKLEEKIKDLQEDVDFLEDDLMGANQEIDSLRDTIYNMENAQ